MQVDATGLAEGLHYAEVIGTSSSEPKLGPIFRRASLGPQGCCIRDCRAFRGHIMLPGSVILAGCCMCFCCSSAGETPCTAGQHHACTVRFAAPGAGYP